MRLSREVAILWQCREVAILCGQAGRLQFCVAGQGVCNFVYPVWEVAILCGQAAGRLQFCEAEQGGCNFMARVGRLQFCEVRKLQFLYGRAKRLQLLSDWGREVGNIVWPPGRGGCNYYFLKLGPTQPIYLPTWLWTVLPKEPRGLGYIEPMSTPKSLTCFRPLFGFFLG